MSATVSSQTTTLDPRHASYDCKTPADHIALYDKWAETYDADVRGSTTLYVGPELTVQAVLAAGGKVDGEVLDAGCGTGLCGIALANAGAKSVDGIDLSPGMLKLARKTGAYRDLAPADMTKNIEQPDNKYDVVTCVGTFTTAHVGPSPAIPELIRVMKKGGIFTATVYEKIWKPEGFEAEVQRLKESGEVDVLGTDLVDYRKAEDAKAILLVLRKN